MSIPVYNLSSNLSSSLKVAVVEEVLVEVVEVVVGTPILYRCSCNPVTATVSGEELAEVC